MFNTFLRPSTIKESEHTMGCALYGYLKMKMHHCIDQEGFNHIHIIGHHDRHSTVISSREKTGKITNWQRPTASFSGDTLIIHCYPGKDYVRHYAAMIESYLLYEGKSHIKVTYQLPSEYECLLPIINSGLSSFHIHKTVILGYAIDKMFPDAELTETNDFYIGKTIINNTNVTLLIFKHSFWG